MSFLYKNKCFSTALELNSAVAADCSVVSGNMIGVTCTPTASDVSVSGWVAGVNYVSTVVPVQIPCVVPDLQPVSELAWLVVGCWVLAWGLRKVIQQIPGGAWLMEIDSYTQAVFLAILGSFWILLR